MATHATGAANLTAFHPVQLTLQLCSQRPPRAARPRVSYWERVDLADVGGELHARNHAVRVLLAAQPATAAARGPATTTPCSSQTRVSAVPPGRCPPAWTRSALGLTPSPATAGGFSTPPPVVPTAGQLPRSCAGSRSLTCSERHLASARRHANLALCLLPLLQTCDVQKPRLRPGAHRCPRRPSASRH
jgi:hypothetical protein